MEDLSRSNGYDTYRSNSNRRDEMPERPSSDALVDLHVYLVPHNLWRERYNNFLNQNVTETVSAGIIRVHPEQKVIVLRDEIDSQIGAELVPREYVFLKSVGRSITKLKTKQEYQLKVKNFIPPQSYAPELFLLEAQDVDSSRSSVRPDSPEYTTGRKSDRTPYTSHNTNPTSPEYNMSSAENLTSRQPAGVKHNYPSPFHHSPIPKIPTKNNPDPRRYESMDPDSHLTPDDVINSYSRAPPYQTPPRGQGAQSPPSREDRNEITPPRRQDRGVNRGRDPASGRDSDTPTDIHQPNQVGPQRSQSPTRVMNRRSQSPERIVENNRSRSPPRQVHQSKSPPRYNTEKVRSQDKPNEQLARIDDDNVATPPKQSERPREVPKQFERPREVPTRKEQNKSPIREAEKPQVKQGRKVASPVPGKVQTNGTSRPLSASWGSDQDSQKSPSPGGAPPPKQKPQKEAVPRPPLSATPPPLVESSNRPVAAGNKYDPRLETYTDHTNEDSGIAGLTPEDHYRENQDDVLDRRKRESEENRRREAELQNRLKADQEEREQKDKVGRDKEWERHEQLEEERRRKDEEEKRRREEEKRRKEEDDKRREDDDEARREQERNLDRLSASDESTKGKVMSGRLSSSHVIGQPDRTSTPNSVKVTVQLSGNRVTDVNVSMAEGSKSVASDRNISTDIVPRSSSQTTGYLTDREDSGINGSYHSDKNTLKSGSDQGRHSNISKHKSETSQNHAEKGDSSHGLDYQSDIDGTGTDQGQTKGQGHIEKEDSRVNESDGEPQNHKSGGHQSLSRNQSESDKVQNEEAIQASSVIGKQKGNETNSTGNTNIESQSELKDNNGSQVRGERSPSQVKNMSPTPTRGEGQQHSDSGKSSSRHTGPVVLTSNEPVIEPRVSESRYVGQQPGEATQPVQQSGGLQVHSGNSGSGHRKTPSSGKHKEVSWSDDVIDNESLTSSREGNRPDPGRGSSREDSQTGQRSSEIRDTFAPKRAKEIRPGTYTRPQSSFQGPRRVPQTNSQVSNKSPRHQSLDRVPPRPVVPRIQLGSDSSVDSHESRQGTLGVVHTPSGWHTQRGSKPSNVPPPQDGYQTDVSNQDSNESQPRDNELNRFPSPPPLKMSTPSSSKGPRKSQGGSDTERGQHGKTEKEQLMRELEQAREARKTTEKQREDLVKKAKMLQNKMQNRRNHARDLWKKRYFEEKKRTSPLEEQCNRLRHELEIIHRKLMNTLEGPTKDKATQRVGDLKPSLQSNYKIQAARLMHEIEDIRRRLENAKMKLTAEMKLRNQAETELRAMRAELIQKKINRTLTRHQQFPSSLSVSDPYLNHTAISPRS